MKKLLASLLVATAPGYLVLPALLVPKIVAVTFAVIFNFLFGGGLLVQFASAMGLAIAVVEFAVFGGLGILPVTGNSTVDLLVNIF
jgi:hypothetical protein